MVVPRPVDFSSVPPALFVIVEIIDPVDTIAAAFPTSIVPAFVMFAPPERVIVGDPAVPMTDNMPLFVMLGPCEATLPVIVMIPFRTSVPVPVNVPVFHRDVPPLATVNVAAFKLMVPPVKMRLGVVVGGSLNVAVPPETERAEAKVAPLTNVTDPPVTVRLLRDAAPVTVSGPLLNVIESVPWAVMDWTV